MGGFSNQTETPGEKQSSKSSSNRVESQAMSPVLRFSPRYNGSTLYDSYEFQAVTEQLNKAFRGSKMFSSPRLCSLRSPFYQRRLDCIYRESTKTPKRISCLRISNTANDDKPSNRGAAEVTKGVVTWLWKKVKHGFMRNGERNESKQ